MIQYHEFNLSGFKKNIIFGKRFSIPNGEIPNFFVSDKEESLSVRTNRKSGFSAFLKLWS